MGYTGQFELFDPLTDVIHPWPYPQLPDIASRARNLLKGRTHDEVSRLAHEASDKIEEYFRLAEEGAIESLTPEDEVELFENNEDGGRGYRLEDLVGKIDFPRPDNTSEIDVLDECLVDRPEKRGDGVPKPKKFEYFAVVALWKIGDAIREIGFKHDRNANRFVWINESRRGVTNERNAGEHLITAMEAVGRAELLRETDQVWQEFEARLEAVKKSADEKVRGEIDSMWKELLAEDAARRSEQARARARMRHRPRDEARAAVLAEWEKDPKAFRSMSRAAKHFVSWLEKSGFESFDQRTVVSWLSAHAKEKNISPR